MALKLNLGSHSKRIRGDWINVDALELLNVDIVHNLVKYPYPWEDNSVDEILLVEVLEHISFRETDNVLKEIYRILKKGGKFHIQVPDCGSMMKAYCENEISAVVPHKPESDEQVVELFKKTGKLVHPNRWIFSFLGAQKHEFDTHKNIFTKERMEDYLLNAGFEVDFKDDIKNWKIIVNAIKKI